MFEDFERIAAAFRSDGALAWGDHSPRLFRGTAEFFRPGYQHHLTSEWIPALDGVAGVLANGGAKIADVGCGHGVSSVVMAQAYPDAKLHDFEFHAPSIDAAHEGAGIAGVGDRAHFQVASADAFRGEFDLICFFDCLHDMGDPVGIAVHAKAQLAAGGSVMLVEPFAHSDKVANHILPMAKMLDGASTVVCTPNSLSRDVGRAMGVRRANPECRQCLPRPATPTSAAGPRHRSTLSTKRAPDTRTPTRECRRQRAGTGERPVLQ